MPKIYGDRNEIREGLIRTGRQLFSLQGLKNTRVEDLCLGSGMAKGTFYHFFPSKEALFLEVFFQAQEDLFQNIRHEVLPRILRSESDRALRLEALMTAFLDLALGDPILRRVRDREDGELFQNRLSPELQEAFQARDRTWAGELTELLHSCGIPLNLNPATGGRLMRHLYLAALEAGSTTDPLVRFLIQACARGLL